MNYPNKTVTEDAAMTNPGAMLETAKSLDSAVRKEMGRIARLFEPSAGDKEDLISYARGIAALRTSAIQGEPVAWPTKASYADDWKRQIINAGVAEDIAEAAVMLAALNGLFDHLAHPAIGTPDPRRDFEKILASLNYDGVDANSLTVGEIRRALP